MNSQLLPAWHPYSCARPRSPNQGRITNHPSRSQAETENRHRDESTNLSKPLKPWILTRTMEGQIKRKVASSPSPDHKSNEEYELFFVTI
uniref:Uncharacterized protein n=1 Tax=Arundo donax TaxID=35708 RepID=A0A0A9DJC4_ARUDO